MSNDDVISAIWDIWCHFSNFKQFQTFDVISAIQADIWCLVKHQDIHIVQGHLNLESVEKHCNDHTSMSAWIAEMQGKLGF